MYNERVPRDKEVLRWRLGGGDSKAACIICWGRQDGGLDYHNNREERKMRGRWGGKIRKRES